MKRIYFDYAASTPVDPRVLRAMQPYLTEKFGNPGSLHAFGQEAIAAVDHARESIARAIGAEFRELIFTGSATEANNLALRGVLKAARTSAISTRPRIIVSAIEHESVLETARELEREGVDIIYLPVDQQGIVSLPDLKKSLTNETILVSIMSANNEVGSIQPIAEIAKIIREFKFKKNAGGKGWYPILHTDAAQAFQFLDCNVQAVGVDLMTISSHKIYGPKGAGALYIKSEIAGKARSGRSRVIEPIMTGGGQEFGLRSGTENVPAIVGFAKAAELIVANRTTEAKKIESLKNYFWKGIKKIKPDVEQNGDGAGGESLPSILNVYFPGNSTQDMLTKFDLAGLAASSGSACRSRAFESSYVIEALGVSKRPKERANSSIRFSLGRPTTKKEIDAALKVINTHLFL